MPSLSLLLNATAAVVWMGLDSVMGSPLFEGIPGTAIIQQVNNEGTAAAAEDYPSAFHWDATNGLTNIGHLDIPGYGSQHVTSANGISSSGAVVVGSSTTYGGFSQKSLAYQWTRQEGMTALGDTTVRESRAYGVSSDGRTVAGWVITDDGQHAVIWQDGQEFLRLEAGTSFWAISPNGLWAAGSQSSGSVSKPIRWSASTGMSLLAPVAENNSPNAISDDGNTVAGQGTTGEPDSTLPFRWTAADGYQFITPSTTGDQGYAFAMSADGRTIVGPSPAGAFIWTQENGYRLLEDVLRQQHGADLTRWGLNSAWCVSPDGLTVGGLGFRFTPFDSNYERQGFIARLGPSVAITPQGPLIQVEFRGVLQSSPNLSDWEDILPRPTSPLLVSPSASGHFYRSRTPNPTAPPP